MSRFLSIRVNKNVVKYEDEVGRWIREREEGGVNAWRMLINRRRDGGGAVTLLRAVLDRPVKQTVVHNP